MSASNLEATVVVAKGKDRSVACAPIRTQRHPEMRSKDHHNVHTMSLYLRHITIRRDDSKNKDRIKNIYSLEMGTNVYRTELESHGGGSYTNCKYDNIQASLVLWFGRTTYAIDVNWNGPFLPITLCSPIVYPPRSFPLHPPSLAHSFLSLLLAFPSSFSYTLYRIGVAVLFTTQRFLSLRFRVSFAVPYSCSSFLFMLPSLFVFQ